MRSWVLAALMVFIIAGPLFGEERMPLKEKRDRVSYTVGVDIGTTLKKQSVDVNVEVLKEAIRDVLTGKKLLLTDAEMAEIRVQTEKEGTERKEKQMKAIAEKNRKEEEKFLAENKSKEGVICLPSGLQYKVIRAGSGGKPKEDDVVLVHYRVALLDGTEVENSHKKAKPESFELENVIPGWREGAQLMQVGSHWRLFIPSKLAYGEDGVGELLGPNTMLIFDLELLKILDKTEEKAADKAGK